MTHEKKPESAEFRTRAEHIVMIMCEAEYSDIVREKGLEELFDTILAEAEARGAEDQRRKDAEGAEEWRPMGTAPKDGTSILAKMVSTPETFGDIRSHWSGRFVVVQHEGVTARGFDLRWRVACPVGFGGIPDEWFEGWRPVDRPANVAALEARVKELEGRLHNEKDLRAAQEVEVADWRTQYYEEVSRNNLLIDELRRRNVDAAIREGGEHG